MKKVITVLYFDNYGRITIAHDKGHYLLVRGWVSVSWLEMVVLLRREVICSITTKLWPLYSNLNLNSRPFCPYFTTRVTIKLYVIGNSNCNCLLIVYVCNLWISYSNNTYIQLLFPFFFLKGKTSLSLNHNSYFQAWGRIIFNHYPYRVRH